MSRIIHKVDREASVFDKLKIIHYMNTFEQQHHWKTI